MEKTEALISSLSIDEHVQFKDFLQRKRRQSNRLDIQLFDFLKSDRKLSPEEIIEKLYGNQNKKARNSYSALKKRLAKNLELFIFIQRTRTDNTYLSQAFMYISLAKQLYSKRQIKLAESYLKLAENISNQNGNIELKSLIQSIKIENSENKNKKDLQFLINAKKNSLDIARIQAEKLMAWSLLKNQIELFAFSGKSFPMSEMKTLLNDQNIQESIKTDPRMLFGLADLMRKAAFTAKDFDQFADFIGARIEEMEQSNVFTDDNLFYKLHLYYMQAHILYRKRSFEKALQKLDFLMTEIKKYSRRYKPLFGKKVALLKALIFTYTGELDEAMAISKTLSRKKNNQEFKAGLAIHTAFFQFCRGNFKEANKICLRFPISEKWSRLHLGNEFLLKFKMIHIIILLELGHTDLAIGKLEYTFKDHESDKLNPFFSEAFTFLNHIKMYLRDADYLSPKNKSLLASFETVVGWKSDIQIISYNSWIKSKLLRKDYYEVLVESMKVATT